MAAGGRGKGRPTSNETAEIDQAIRDAALQVLLEHGQGATVNAVAQAAGLSRKSLYTRYPNKSELFVEAIRDMLGRVNGIVYDHSGTAEQRLQHYIEAALGVISRPHSQAMQRLLRMEPVYISTLRADMLTAMRKLFFEPLVALLAEAHAQGEFVVEDVEATAAAIIRMTLPESNGDDQADAALPPLARRADAGAFVVKLITQGLTPR